MTVPAGGSFLPSHAHSARGQDGRVRTLGTPLDAQRVEC